MELQQLINCSVIIFIEWEMHSTSPEMQSYVSQRYWFASCTRLNLCIGDVANVMEFIECFINYLCQRHQVLGYRRLVVVQSRSYTAVWLLYTGCVKSSRPTLTHYNFDKGGPIFIIF